MKTVIRIIEIMIVISIILTSCGKSIEQQLSEQLELGQKYLEDGNYEQAVVVFKKVISIDPKSWEAYASISIIYQEQDRLEKAAEILEQGIAALGLDQTPMKYVDRLVGIYRILADRAAKNGDQELAISYYEKILVLRPETEDIAVRNKEAGEISRYEQELKTMALSIIAEEEYDFRDALILGDGFQELIADLTGPVFFQMDNGTYVGVYPGGYLYSGDMLNGLRQGNGRWFYGNIRKITVVASYWDNDQPNGFATVKTMINTDQIEREKGHTYAMLTIDTVNLIDGVYEGEGSKVWVMEKGNVHDWNVVYEGGFLQPNSGEYAAYCKNCNASLKAGGKQYKVKGID